MQLLRRGAPALVALLALAGALAPTAGAAVPTTDAPADTWRGRTEAWVGTVVFPALFGRTGAPAARRTFAHQAVQGSPRAVALGLAATPEARRRQAGWAYEQGLARPASAADRTYWAGRLASGWSHDRMVSHLLGSAEASRRFPANVEWIGWAYQQALGRTPDAAGVAYWDQRLRDGTPRSFAARQILAAGEARQRVVTATWSELFGRAPGSGERTWAQSLLRGSGGDPQALRAEAVTPLAPAGYRVGVVGDSVGFDLVFRAAGQPLPAVVTGGGRRPQSASRLACGVLSDRAGYRWPRDPQLATSPPGAAWGAPSDGRCPEELARLEDILLDAGPDVLVWAIGAWEWTRVMRPDGTIIAERSTAMREEVATAMVRRIDGWTARGVQRVVLPEWACVGHDSAPIFRHPGYTRFVRSILAEVVRRRPGVAIMAATPPEVCVDGNPEGQPTAAHRAARGDQFHWATGSGGAAWGWRTWFAPAIADLRGVA